MKLTCVSLVLLSRNYNRKVDHQGLVAEGIPEEFRLVLGLILTNPVAVISNTFFLIMALKV